MKIVYIMKHGINNDCHIDLPMCCVVNRAAKPLDQYWMGYEPTSRKTYTIERGICHFCLEIINIAGLDEEHTMNYVSSKVVSK